VPHVRRRLYRVEHGDTHLTSFLSTTGLPFSFTLIRAIGVSWSYVQSTSHFSGIAR
jgi:hypothetical protein